MRLLEGEEAQPPMDADECELRKIAYLRLFLREAPATANLASRTSASSSSPFMYVW